MNNNAIENTEIEKQVRAATEALLNRIIKENRFEEILLIRQPPERAEVLAMAVHNLQDLFYKRKLSVIVQIDAPAEKEVTEGAIASHTVAIVAALTQACNQLAEISGQRAETLQLLYLDKGQQFSRELSKADQMEYLAEHFSPFIQT
ncbi:hypothetical protein [Microcoleus sp. FACHB-672]|uniref:hypothetical protein n=1 Tax=Microcoleus sp. FACHB-672 TaxID=2692825 RepID=UPI00168A04AE|nr:hypothetical protein [Microcoleus sp. FACHB-672]MBD2039706.1 hypothetical protein [Microcoleus sp. FACHB-672]